MPIRYIVWISIGLGGLGAMLTNTCYQVSSCFQVKDSMLLQFTSFGTRLDDELVVAAVERPPSSNAD